MIRVTYKGVDITSSVSVNRCFHEMWAAGNSDTLDIRFNDPAHLWDGWAVQVGDEIRIDNGSASTGTMFVRSASPENGLFTVKAMSAPVSALERTDKAWQAVRLLQIGQEIANRHGLQFKSYGVEDHLYPYILQSGMSDFAFLHQRTKLEGCAFLVYDKTLVMYDIATMEAIAPAGSVTLSLDGDYVYQDNRSLQYGTCVLNAGSFRGEYTAANGSSHILRHPVTFDVGSKEEAKRFAKGLLRDANSDCMTGYIRTKGIVAEYAAGSTVNIVNPRAPSWDGSAFLYRVRHDHVHSTSKLFFRKTPEGFV